MTVCTWCGTELEGKPWACRSCGNDPASGPGESTEPAATETNDAATTAEAIAGVVPERSIASAARWCSAAGCGAPIPPGADACPICEAPVAAPGAGPSTPALIVVFPWGPFPLPTGGLELGREVGPAEVQRGTSGYPNVSRHHATIRQSNGTFAITDNRSTNGTFVDGRRLAPAEPWPLHDGSVVRLGATLEFTISDGAT